MVVYRLAIVNSHPVQYFSPLYRRLAAEKRIDLSVYYCSRAGLAPFQDPGFAEDVRWDVPLLEGYTSKFLPNSRNVDQPSGFWSLLNPTVVREIREEDYDAVWLHGHNYATNLLAVGGALSQGTCLFMRCDTHLGLDRPLWKRFLRPPVMSLFYRLFDACLAIGSRNAEFYRAHGVPDEKIFLVPCVVDNERFREGAEMREETIREVRDELGLPEPEVPVILFLSKLIDRKRPFDLLRAFRGVREKLDFRVALAYVGSGSEMERLKDCAAAWGMEDVHFLGFRNQSQLPRIYGASDVFVLPSENEPWGLVVNEAMAAGLPVIVSDEVGAGADLVKEGTNGYLYPCGDVIGLAERLSQLLQDETKRIRMGGASEEIVADWDFERCVEGIKRALEYGCAPRE